MPKVKKSLATAVETYDCALRLMSLRDHSQKELRDKLAQRDATGQDIEAALAKLEDYGIVNDERYAQRLYESWLAKRVYGRQHLLAELCKHGVPKEFFPRILEQYTPALEAEHAELAAEQFCRINRKKIEQVLRSREPKVKQKLYAAAGRYMAAKGFGGGYMEVLKEQLQQAAELLLEE